MTDSETLLEFPCEFPIKAMGHNLTEFDVLVVEIIRRHTTDLTEGCVRMRESKNGKYLAVTVTIRAQSQQQLDAIYHDLTDASEVLMAL